VISTASNGEDTCTGAMIGILIIIAFSVAGFMLMINAVTTSDVGAGTILFYILVIPGIGCAIGIPILIRSTMRGTATLQSRMRVQTSTVERSFVHVPPPFCSSCGGKINSEHVDWVGPLSVKCPYCGATLATEKREI
jgi:predicted RNA-binding Zn-ribbon protein involved in translation (DUF1610 family)